ncbi:MAG: hypothetical protein ACREPR_18035 [Brasilonema sp.]
MKLRGVGTGNNPNSIRALRESVSQRKAERVRLVAYVDSPFDKMLRDYFEPGERSEAVNQALTIIVERNLFPLLVERVRAVPVGASRWGKQARQEESKK